MKVLCNLERCSVSFSITLNEKGTPTAHRYFISLLDVLKCAQTQDIACLIYYIQNLLNYSLYCFEICWMYVICDKTTCGVTRVILIFVFMLNYNDNDNDNEFVCRNAEKFKFSLHNILELGRWHNLNSALTSYPFWICVVDFFFHVAFCFSTWWDLKF